MQASADRNATAAAGRYLTREHAKKQGSPAINSYIFVKRP
jgi:hypothetical protein